MAASVVHQTALITGAASGLGLAIARHFGRIDILVNSAGITGLTNLKSHETDTANLRKVFEVNFMDSYHTSKYVLPLMVDQGYGAVIRTPYWICVRSVRGAGDVLV
jgi:NAD(P)-dependent dehydrogenase (short-subunit alcohol dehydrogenase family)